MSDWINRIKSEDEKKAQSQNDKDLIIQRFSSDIINSLVNLSQKTAETVNAEIFKIDNLVKVNSLLGEGRFRVYIDRLPAAYLDIKLDYDEVIITRTLITKSLNGNESDTNELPSLGIGLTVDNIPYIHLNGKRLSDDEKSEALVSPVVMHHRKNYEPTF